MEWEIKTLVGFKEEEILDVFNRSFSDYSIPLQLTKEQLVEKMKLDNFNPAISVGVVKHGKLIAFILHGSNLNKDEIVIYNGGTGVIPEERGFGLTQKMYKFILPILKENNVKKAVLEVIHDNLPAIKSYEVVGFKKRRGLICLKGELNIKISNSISIFETPGYDWKLFTSFWDFQPSWQNSNRVMNKLKAENVSYSAFSNDELVGYAIFNPKRNRIQQIAVHKNHRRERIATSLVNQLSQVYGHSFSVLNSDSTFESATLFFQSIGLHQNLKQLELELVL